MTVTHLTYFTTQGYLHHWLTAGPLAAACPCPSRPSIPSWGDRPADAPGAEAEVNTPVVDRGALSDAPPLSALTWQYYRCRDDHFIDFSAFYPTCTWLETWAFCQVRRPAPDSSAPWRGVFHLTTDALVEVRLNGQRLEHEAGSGVDLITIAIPVSLKAGLNDVLIHLGKSAVRDTPLRLALELVSADPQETAENEIAIPTTIEPGRLKLRQALEELAEKATLDRYVYGYLGGDKYSRNEAIPLQFPAEITPAGKLTYRLQSLNGDIFQEGTKEFAAESMTEMAKIFPLRNGPHHLALLPPAEEYYLHHLQFERQLLFHVVRTAFSSQPYGEFSARASEALADAASRRNESLYCEIAKLARDDWERFDWKVANQALRRVSQKYDGSIYDLVGILGMLARYGRRKRFFKAFFTACEQAVLDYPFTNGGSALEAGTAPHPETGFGMDCNSESRQIACLAGEILAGQRFPDKIFARSGKTGRWHQAHGEAQAKTWLRLRGQCGFREWDSPASMEAILAVLSHLVDLARSKTVRDMAATLMDKLFFILAVNSFQGAFGGSKGQAETAEVLSSRLEATSGLARLMWGCGNFNEHVMGIVSLASCAGYQLPPVLARIAADQPGALWGLAHYRLPSASNHEQTVWEVNKALYKTADFMLSSALDYYPGRAGSTEHIWQATFGPDAIVYVNHPACMREEDTHQPNLWRGNGALPRVAQWGDVLIAIYNAPPNDWMGFTHAYFPVAAFDKTAFQGSWAFACKGNGYLALRAASGFEAITQGQTAYRELRAPGGQNIWLCHLGQALLDGSFENFQQKILAMPVRFEPLSVQVETLRGDHLAFGWQTAWQVNGTEQALTGFKQYETPYATVDLPARQMEMLYQSEGLRLYFT